MKDEERHPKGKGCWYKIHIRECVLCMKTDEWRERMWTPKPNNPADRYDYKQFACWSHFL
jgi:hypothetical protein